ncbi:MULTISPECIES: DegT/DnrJ/EryC1/StrS aminotransferase family protein [unclassified Methanosarcina]|uniref:DegT/DnrJ/EryC1/StrS family aminotransferase n=1 Tax=unclassified Methanosarcina TaxID=2644672 RepID=UPI00190FDBFB|nr:MULTISPECIES: DegT/DnrJ/EryC1/StrS family aminotransferase [unclassified Methanosarcina]
MDGNEKKYLMECIDTGWISSEGPFVKEFEEKFSAKVGRRYGIAVCNGSAALDVAVAALELKEGDEVIMPTFTIISCANAVIMAGATPVLVDSDSCTWNMDVNQIESKITPKTRAIMVVHIYGLPVDMDPVIKLARKYELNIIEDAAEAHGQTYNGKPCGSFGDISAFSFYANKHITTGEGGMVVTDDEELAERCRSLRNLCFQANRRYVHEEMGWNFRITNLQAAVGLAQLERLNEFAKKKREMGKYYTEKLKNIGCIQLPLERTPYADNIYWVYGIVLNDEIGVNSEEIMARLNEKKIGTRSFFYPMHEQPVFHKMGLFENESYPVAERIARKGFYIPSGLALTQEQMDEVIKVIREELK